MPDARVQAAIDNWGSRLIANGVDYNDFRRVTSSLERWDDWLDAWTATADGHREQAERAREAGHDVSAGEAFVRAAVCYHFAKFVWVLDVERNRAATEQAIAALAARRTSCSTRRPSGSRRRSTARASPANLRRPRGVERPPLIVLIPGLDSTKEEFFHWESVFLARGMATLSMDGPGQGESGFALNIRPDYEVGGGGDARRARRARRRRPRAGRRRGRQHGRLLRAAGGGVRAAHQGRRGRSAARTT